MSESNAYKDGNSAATTATVAESTGAISLRGDTSLFPVGPLQVPPSQTGTADPFASGIDYRRAWHAFRRRWLPSVVLGMLVSIGSAVPTWMFLPKGYEAAAWLRVRDKTGMMTSGGRDAAEYEAYRKTQVQLIKSPFVLTAALRMPGIMELGMLRDETDPVNWLTRNIQVNAPMESEVVQVRLRGENAADVTKIANAVTEAYLEDIVNKERAERLGRRSALEKKYKENMAEMRTRRETFNALARTLGAHDSAEVATQRSLLLDHLGSLRNQITQSERDLEVIDAELAILEAKASGEISGDQAVPEEIVAMQLARDPTIVELSSRLTSIDEAIAYQAQRSARGGNEPAVKRLLIQRKDAVNRIASRQVELRPQIVAQLTVDGVGRRPGQTLEGPSVLKMRRKMLASSLEEDSREFTKISKEATQLGQANADLEARKGEMEQLQHVTDQIGVQLESTAIDLSMPNRVTLIEEASVPEKSDQLLRMLLSLLAGMTGLVLGGGLIVFFEYMRDCLSTAEEVVQRIGGRMLGTLPLNRLSKQGGNEGLMAECVDNIRTVIAQTGREAPKVILVTSAVEHEGKTTFAAQLAASLARSNKRTLLLDGDLRHPTVHVALELDLGVGFSELLRGELSTDEAVQPTTIEGLFAVTGGLCDYAAVTALSRSETTKIFGKFRESFEHVVIDAGPVLAFADALLLGQQSDVAIVATMCDTSRVPLVIAAIDKLRSVGVKVLGTVVNGVSDSAPRRLYASPLPS